MHPQDSLEDDIITIKPRDYKCPCGKSYLSYAALFTHIKQKHEGKVTFKLLRLQARSPNRPPNTKKEEGPPSNPNKTKKNPKRQTQTSLLLLSIRCSLPRPKNSGHWGKQQRRNQSVIWLQFSIPCPGNISTSHIWMKSRCSRRWMCTWIPERRQWVTPQGIFVLLMVLSSSRR